MKPFNSEYLLDVVYKVRNIYIYIYGTRDYLRKAPDFFSERDQRGHCPAGSSSTTRVVYSLVVGSCDASTLASPHLRSEAFLLYACV